MMMSRSRLMSRPSVVLVLGFLILGLCGTSMKAAGNPVPDADETAKTVSDSLNSATDSIKNFFERLKNTFTGRVDATHPGLTNWELAGIIAAAVFIFFFGFCCIGFCLCECIKELVCCICCCGCCRE